MSKADQQPGAGVDGFGLIEELYPGAVLEGEAGGEQLSGFERAARNNEVVFRVMCVLLALFALGATVAGGFGTVAALGDAGRAAAFKAAPVCSASAASAARVGDCLAWKSETVTGVHLTVRNGTTVDLSGGQQLWYGGDDAWVNSLMIGTTVSVLEWEGAAEALRQPGGVAVYSPHSASLVIYEHTSITVAMFSFAVLLGGVLLGLSPLRLWRLRRVTVVAVLLGLLGLSGVAAGFTIDGATSFSAGIITGLVVYPLLTAVVFTGIAISRTRRRRRAESRLTDRRTA